MIKTGYIMRLLSALPFIIVITAVSVFTGCSADGEGNASVKVYNDTDRTIRVYYVNRDEEEDSEGNTTSSNDTNMAENIGSGKTENINAVGDAINDPDIRVVYGGIVKQFTVDVNIFGYGEIHIKQSDFYK